MKLGPSFIAEDWDNQEYTAEQCKKRVQAARYQLWWHLAIDPGLFAGWFDFPSTEALLHTITLLSTQNLKHELKLQPIVDPNTFIWTVQAFGYVHKISNRSDIFPIKAQVNLHLHDIEEIESEYTKMVGYIPFNENIAILDNLNE